MRVNAPVVVRLRNRVVTEYLEILFNCHVEKMLTHTYIMKSSKKVFATKAL